MHEFLLFFLLLTSLIFTGCQAKQEPQTGLISGHVSVQNKFTLTAPLSKSYAAGETLSFTVSFPFDMKTDFTAGTPALTFTLGAASKTANLSASTLRSLTFTYTVAVGENDTDGIDFNSLSLNGGTIKFDYMGVLIDCDTTSLAAQNLSGVKVDTTQPGIATVNHTAPGTYSSPFLLSIVVNYSEVVMVTGIPKISVTLGSRATAFTYAGGSGTKSLTFSLLLQNTDYDFDGLPSAITTIALNGGMITDKAGNSAPLVFNAQDLSQVFVTYPGVRLWTQSSFTSKASSGNPAIINAGVVTLETCGAASCRTFDGDDSLSLAATLGNVNSVFMVVRIPDTANSGMNYDLFTSDISLRVDTVSGNYNLVTSAADVTANGMNSSGTSHSLAFPVSSVQVIEVDFTTARNYPVGVLIDTPFTGGIGEVIAVSGVLTAAQKLAVRDYLLNKY